MSGRIGPWRPPGLAQLWDLPQAVGLSQAASLWRSAGLIAACALLALAGGCGFHLEGRYALPQALSTVRIEAVDTQSDFYFGLRQALLKAGSHIVTDPKDASAVVIHVLEDTNSDAILAVSTLNVPAEYELTYTVRVSVDGAGGHALLAPQTHTLVRDYSYSETEQLAKQREQQILTSALARELAAVVMRQLSSIKSS